LGIDKPIKIDFGNTREKVYDTQLEFNYVYKEYLNFFYRFYHPSPHVQRKISVGGQPDHKECAKRNKVVVIEIIGLVQELNIGEEQEKADGRDPIIKSQYNEE